MKHACAAGVLLAALVVCPPALAADDARSDARDEPTHADPDQAAVALAAGAGVTFVSLGIGGLMIARGKSEFVKNEGLLGAQSGMVLAPLAAHAVVGETTRGLWFSLPLLLPVATNSLFTGLFPSIIKRAPAGVQYATFISFTLSILGSTVGVLDAAGAGERRPKRKASLVPDLSFSPMIGGDVTGAMLSGSLR